MTISSRENFLTLPQRKSVKCSPMYKKIIKIFETQKRYIYMNMHLGKFQRLHFSLFYIFGKQADRVTRHLT